MVELIKENRRYTVPYQEFANKYIKALSRKISRGRITDDKKSEAAYSVAEVFVRQRALKPGLKYQRIVITGLKTIHQADTEKPEELHIEFEISLYNNHSPA